MLLGVVALIVVRQTSPAAAPTWLLVVSAVAVVGWAAIGVLTIEYREPKIMLGIFAALVVAAAVTR